MTREFPESDWKLWRRLFPVALDRFCQETLDWAAEVSSGGGTSHERYLQLYRYIQRRDGELAEVFDSFSRSKALLQIALAARKRLVTPEELASFTEETRARIALLLGDSAP